MAKFPVIALAGKSGVGKDTVAEILISKLKKKGLNATTIALADPIKRLLYDVFDLNPNDLWGSQNDKNKHFELKLPKKRFFTGHPYLKQYNETLYLNYIFGDKLRIKTSIRELCQKTGTEFFRQGRDYNPNLWIDYGIELANKLISTENATYSKESWTLNKIENKPHDYVIITDCRFRNEINAVNAINGTTILIHNEDILKDDFRAHQSETELSGMPESYFDHIIDNDKNEQNSMHLLDTKINYLVYNKILGR